MKKEIKQLTDELDLIEKKVNDYWREIIKIEPKKIEEERKQVETVKILESVIDSIQEASLDIKQIWG